MGAGHGGGCLLPATANTRIMAMQKTVGEPNPMVQKMGRAGLH